MVVVVPPRCFFRSWLLDGRSGKKVKRVGVVHTMLWVDVSECFRVGEQKVNYFCGVYILCGAALSEHFLHQAILRYSKLVWTEQQQEASSSSADRCVSYSAYSESRDSAEPFISLLFTL